MIAWEHWLSTANPKKSSDQPKPFQKVSMAGADLWGAKGAVASLSFLS